MGWWWCNVGLLVGGGVGGWGGGGIGKRGGCLCQRENRSSGVHFISPAPLRANPSTFHTFKRKLPHA